MTDIPEECHQCQQLWRGGEWVETMPATHDSPAEHEWLCEACLERDEAAFNAHVDASIDALRNGD